MIGAGIFVFPGLAAASAGPAAALSFAIGGGVALLVALPTSELATAEVADVLVAVRGTVGMDRPADVVAGLFAVGDVGVTLYHVAAEAETDEDPELLLEGLSDRLVDLGVAADRIETVVERERDPHDAIAAVAGEFDAVVIGESDPSLATFVFGVPADQVAERFLGPVLVVQRERPDEE